MQSPALFSRSALCVEKGCDDCLLGCFDDVSDVEITNQEKFITSLTGLMNSEHFLQLT